MVVGITGYFASGKGKAAEYLVSNYGFKNYGYGDFIRAELKEMNVPLGRDAEYNHANKQRQEHGFGYWSKKIINSIQPGENVVVEGIRNPLELEELASAGDFHLIAVAAPAELRFKRMKLRKKEGDPQTFANFCEKDAREMYNEDPMKQSIKLCVDKAEYIIDNGDGWETFHQQLDAIMEKILHEKR